MSKISIALLFSDIGDGDIGDGSCESCKIRKYSDLGSYNSYYIGADAYYNEFDV